MIRYTVIWHCSVIFIYLILNSCGGQGIKICLLNLVLVFQWNLPAYICISLYWKVFKNVSLPLSSDFCVNILHMETGGLGWYPQRIFTYVRIFWGWSLTFERLPKSACSLEPRLIPPKASERLSKSAAWRLRLISLQIVYVCSDILRLVLELVSPTSERLTKSATWRLRLISLMPISIGAGDAEAGPWSGVPWPLQGRQPLQPGGWGWYL